MLALSALLGAAVVLAGLLVWIDPEGGVETTTSAPTTVAPEGPSDGPGQDGSPEGDAPPTTTPGTAPPTTAPPGSAAPAPGDVVPLACPAEVPAPICEAADFVQRETGRAFRQFPAVELEDDEGFQARLLADYQEDAPEFAAFGRTLSAMGLVAPGVDAAEAVRVLLGVGVVGFYEPAGDVLVVRGTEFTPYTRIIIVHELVHALDDQWFDLDRPQLDEVSSDAVFGFSALTEGHASLVDDRYRSALSPSEQESAAREEFRMLARSGVDLTAVPPVLIEMLGAPYLLGAPLVERILDEGGPEAVASAYGRPPATSEQVMHPDSYLAAEPAVEVPAPPADGEVVEEDVMGQHGVELWLSDVGAAAGWGGDRYVTWADGDGSCTRMDLVMDTARDLAEARAAFGEWASAAPRRSVDDIPVGDGPGLRVTGCTTP